MTLSHKNLYVNFTTCVPSRVVVVLPAGCAVLYRFSPYFKRPGHSGSLFARCVLIDIKTSEDFSFDKVYTLNSSILFHI